ncbi:DUF2062 domain-containing protein [Pelagicoccus sp. SDUM812003]|uniref:DUF2062 domain-containing protein n=1 Tax=Pelagicoccus sp. SDUM812003 TaxID=3041267 RepID=UPI00280D754E|nr:DUF2062 domain-containing protein [Pelagicoccus sp. SDUM812003]MDQ8201698.1 DUF2062 domain-containing protein [Pelagicoccus sp. SDUM812003]
MFKITDPEHRQAQEQRARLHSRIRRAKQFLRPLPRRTNLHRWPVLKWFAKTARKSPFLWRFSEREVRLAIYLGSIIAFLPIFGAQFIVAFFVALAVRANLLVIMSVQLVTNVITAAPIYIFTAKVGAWLVDLWHLPSMHQGIVRVTYNTVIGGIIVGLIFGFIVDMIVRFVIFRRLSKGVDVKRMLKS